MIYTKNIWSLLLNTVKKLDYEAIYLTNQGNLGFYFYICLARYFKLPNVKEFEMNHFVSYVYSWYLIGGPLQSKIFQSYLLPPMLLAAIKMAILRPLQFKYWLLDVKQHSINLDNKNKMEEHVHKAWMPSLPGKVNNGIILEQNKW